jgi:dTDP-4-dehydrorhamnose reductase
MTILLLGAAGNLGTAFTNCLKDKEGFTLVSWDKPDIDVTDEGLLLKKISDIRPDVIINSVAYNDVDACESKEEAADLARQLNVELVANLARAAVEVDARLVHFSSDYVFNGDSEQGYAEDDEPSPQSVYAQSKRDGETELISLTGKGLRWYLVRTSKLFGPRGSSPAAKPSFFELMLKLAKRGEAVKIVSDERGSFTYTVDLAAAVMSLIEEECPSGIYHLVNSGEASWFEAAEYFFNKLGLKVETSAVAASDFPRPASRPKHSLLLNTKRPALRNWQAALDDYISNYKIS